MRTTVTVDDDVFAAMEQLRAEQGLGPSAALNLLARRGMTQGAPRPSRYVHRSSNLGLRMDVSNIAEVLEILDEPGLHH